MIKLVLSDIDGTLLPFDRCYIDQETVGAIDALEEVGITFAIATGRPAADINKAFNDTLHWANCVAADGMSVYLNGNVVVQKVLPNDQLQQLAEAINETNNATLGICYNDQNDGTLPIVWATVGITERGREILNPHNKYAVQVPDFEKIPDNSVFVCGVFGPSDNSMTEEIVAITNEKTQDLHALNSAPGYYDICFTSWNKANGAEALLKAMGISNEEAVFFGDSQNDISLFNYFKNTFCVASGSEDAKQAARWIIPDPQDGGAANVMRALVKHKGNLQDALESLGLES